MANCSLSCLSFPHTPAWGHCWHWIGGTDLWVTNLILVLYLSFGEHQRVSKEKKQRDTNSGPPRLGRPSGRCGASSPRSRVSPQNSAQRPALLPKGPAPLSLPRGPIQHLSLPQLPAPSPRWPDAAGAALPESRALSLLGLLFVFVFYKEISKRLPKKNLHKSCWA